MPRADRRPERQRSRAAVIGPRQYQKDKIMRRGPSPECMAQIEAFDQILPMLRNAFRLLENKLSPPVLRKVYDRIYPRHHEKSASYAALQKLARYLSGLRALQILLSYRMLQEDGVIKRTLDELQEDIIFLVMDPINPEESALRERFLTAFYQEEFDETVPPIDSTRTRDQIRRKKIRAYIERRQASAVPKGKQAASIVYQAYSGYVHAASPHIMEMCSFNSLRFSLDGSENVELFESHVRDAVNYFVQGFYVVAAMASKLGKPKLYQDFKSRGDQLSDTWN